MFLTEYASVVMLLIIILRILYRVRGSFYGILRFLTAIELSIDEMNDVSALDVW